MRQSQLSGLPSESASSSGESATVGDLPSKSASSRSRPARHKRKARSARALFQFDRALGSRWVAGADEAGRGSLAGPLVAGAVLFDLEELRPADIRSLKQLNDSKLVAPEVREELFPRILRVAASVAITVRSARSIDHNGLHVTNLDALCEVLKRVGRDGCICLSDGFALAETGFEQRAVIDGDTYSAAIAAASVVAKVTRDRFMKRMDLDYPEWGFGNHVGYSTPQHRASIAQHGLSPLHRLSFQSIAYEQLGLEELETTRV